MPAGIEFTSMVSILAVGLFGATWIAGIVGTIGEQSPVADLIRQLVTPERNDHCH